MSNGGQADAGIRPGSWTPSSSSARSPGCSTSSSAPLFRMKMRIGDTDENSTETHSSATSEEIAAVRWASGFKRIDVEAIRSLVERMPRWCVAEQMERYRAHLVNVHTDHQAHEAKQELKAGRSRRQYCSTLLRDRLVAAKRFATFLRSRNVDVNAAPLKLPHGIFASYMEQNQDLQKACNNKSAKARHRKWLLRGLRVLPCEMQLATASTCNVDRGESKRQYVRDAKRRKVLGQYGSHLVKAHIVRQQLFEWFSIMRHSIDLKVMTRFPPAVVALKAKQLVQDYVAACLQAGQVPDPPQVTSKWIKSWQMEYRLSVRRPNRKFKVPKKVLEQRLCVFWLNLLRVRQFAILHFGYDLEITNMDQSPFHMNEAGSKVRIIT